MTLFTRRAAYGHSQFLVKLRVVHLDDNVQLIRTALICAFKRVTGKSFDYAICIDPHGFLVCSMILPFVRPIYYSLELYAKSDHFGLHYPWWIRFNERSKINSIRGLIIQSQEKDEIFRLDYRLRPEVPSFILPVTYDGPSSSVKSRHLRTKFNINPDVKIALHLGGIAEWFSCIELALTFSGLSGWVLIFHGFSSPDYLASLRELLARNGIKNVYINDEQYADLEMVNEVIRSCDIGIAWYNDISVGFRTAGHSSGKIPAYMRFGLPVVAKRYRSTCEAIENVGAGLCVDEMEDIPVAIEQIMRNYDRFSTGARDAYDKSYNFHNYINGLDQFLSSCHGDLKR